MVWGRVWGEAATMNQSRRICLGAVRSIFEQSQSEVGDLPM
jgi:hypothetical protein